MKEFKFYHGDWPRTMDPVTAKWLVFQVAALLEKGPASTEELLTSLNKDAPKRWVDALGGLPYVHEWIFASVHAACLAAGAGQLWSLKKEEPK